MGVMITGIFIHATIREEEKNCRTLRHFTIFFWTDERKYMAVIARSWLTNYPRYTASLECQNNQPMISKSMR